MPVQWEKIGEVVSAPEASGAGSLKKVGAIDCPDSSVVSNETITPATPSSNPHALPKSRMLIN
jgi:hypothetical protein